MSSLARRYPSAVFTLLAFAFSWLCWVPVLDRIQANPFKSEPDVLLRLLLGGYGPSVAALAVAALGGGWDAVKALLARFKPRGGGAAYMVALVWSPIVVAVSVLAFVTFGGDVGYVHSPALLWVPVMFAAVTVFGPLGEELGWRGFLLPRLLARRRSLAASVITGVVWTLWHAPLMTAAAGTSISGQPVTALSVLAYFVSVTASSVLFTWIFQRAKGSVLAPLLAHVSLNGTAVALGFLLPHLGATAAHTVWLIGVGLLSVGVLPLVVKWVRQR